MIYIIILWIIIGLMQIAVPAYMEYKHELEGKRTWLDWTFIVVIELLFGPIFFVWGVSVGIKQLRKQE